MQLNSRLKALYCYQNDHFKQEVLCQRKTDISCQIYLAYHAALFHWIKL